MSESSRNESRKNFGSSSDRGGYQKSGNRNSSPNRSYRQDGEHYDRRDRDNNRNEGSGGFGGRKFNDRDERGGRSYGDRDNNRSYGKRNDRRQNFDGNRNERGNRFDRDQRDNRDFREKRNDRGGYSNDRPRRDPDHRGDRNDRGFGQNRRSENNHQRGGQQRRDAREFSAAKSAGYRSSKPQGPELDTDVTGKELDGFVARQLRALEKDNAEVVAQHLVMAGRYLDIDPKFALEHAMAATRRAGRIGAVREATGIAAYVAEDFELALRELRTHRRISGSHEHLALLIDSERALGRIEKALELAEESKDLDLQPAERVEIAMVVSGIRHDQGDVKAALAALEIPELNNKRGFEYSPRLFEAYADLLTEDGRAKEAARWFRLAKVTEAALGQGEFAEPEIFDIFTEEELLEPLEESIDLTDVDTSEPNGEEAENQADSEDEQHLAAAENDADNEDDGNHAETQTETGFEADEAEEMVVAQTSAEFVMTKDQAEEENLQAVSDSVEDEVAVESEQNDQH